MKEIKFRVWNDGNNEWLESKDFSIFPDGSVPGLLADKLIEWSEQ